MGGGSGGVIYLSAPEFINDGVVTAAGGAAGTKGSTFCGNGGAGGPGRVRLSVLPELCDTVGAIVPQLDGPCAETVQWTPGTAYVGLYPY